MAKPIPFNFLLFNTGVQAVKSLLVEISYSINDKDPGVWAVHSRDHTAKTFGCLKKLDSAGNAEAFFTSITENTSILLGKTRGLAESPGN
jgi:hypothetical protein